MTKKTHGVKAARRYACNKLRVDRRTTCTAGSYLGPHLATVAVALRRFSASSAACTHPQSRSDERPIYQAECPAPCDATTGSCDEGRLAALKSYVDAGEWLEGMEMFRSLANPPMPVANKLLKLAVKAFQPTEAERFLIDTRTRAHAEGNSTLRPSAAHYATVLSGYGMTGDWIAAQKLFLKAEQDASCGKDIVLYSAYLKALARGGAPLDVAESVFSSMDECSRRTIFRKKSKRPEAETVTSTAKDVICYSTMLKVCEQHGAWQRMRILLDEMSERCIKKDIIVYNTALACCCSALARSGPEDISGTVLAEVDRLLEELEAEKVGKTAVTLSATVRAFELAKAYDCGLQILARYFTGNLATESAVEQQKGSVFASSRKNVVTNQMLQQVIERLEVKSSSALDQTSHAAGGSGNNAGSPENRSAPAGMPDQSQYASRYADTCALMELVETDCIPPKEEYDLAGAAILYLQRLFAENFVREFQLTAYGSLQCDTALRGADIDLTILTSRNRGYATQESQASDDELFDKADRTEQQRVLLKLMNLQDAGLDVLQLGLGGRIPVAKCALCVDTMMRSMKLETSLNSNWSGTGKKLELDFTVDNWHGVKKTEFLKNELAQDKNLRYLTLLVKRWAARRGIIGQTKGYLGGYSFSLLVVHFSRCVYQPLKLHQRSLDSIVAYFFRFYAEQFLWSTNSPIAFHPQTATTSCIEKVEEVRCDSGARLVLWDPIESAWNLGSILNGEKLGHTVNAFKEANRLTEKNLVSLFK